MSGFVAQNSGVDFVCYQIGFVDVVISTGTPVLFIILSTRAVALAVVRERK